MSLSRIGKLPIAIPAGTEVKVENNVFFAKGKLGQLSQEFHGEVIVEIADGNVIVKPNFELEDSSAKHGLYRALFNNMVVGVSQGFEKQLELVGVGYKAEAKGKHQLELALGFSHNIVMVFSDEIEVETINERGKNPIVKLRSYDKQLLGQVAAKIRSYRKPEPYKGKGVKFVGEELRRKQGKAAGK